VLHLDATGVDQLQVGLVDERGGGESAPALFGMHQVSRYPAQLLVDPRGQHIEGGAVALSPIAEEPRGVDVVGFGHGSARNGSFYRAGSACSIMVDQTP
jgi:hypothetical protein